MSTTKVKKREQLSSDEARRVLKLFIAEHSSSNLNFYAGANSEGFSSSVNGAEASIVADDVLNQLKVVKLHLDNGFPH